ncbi:MAG: hypothetical protein E6L03_07635 [Thaumarchaeota archaeon]|jgi:hypothetical protein|nr:MAG: hypothetical protein E6L03_07635 [Nitrososphaerota archaeon]TLX84616.1 MAG: hypothetical protein E6L01_07335 [Nitrososphaerota archaeon]
MIRKLQADRANKTVALEMSENDLSNIIESIDKMVDRQQRILLENLPSDDQLRVKLDSYKALKEDLRKIWETLV